MDFYKPKNSIEEALRVIQEEKAAQTTQTEEKPRKSHWIIRLGLILFIFASLGALVYWYYSQSTVYYSSTAPAGDVVNEVDLVVKAPLPTNETPTIVTVSKLEPLQNQPLFKNARVGDTLLIYTKAKRAILYRPSDKSIVADAILTD